ncbi:MAG: phosphatidylserine/phosphatidylglycerophosphate/cardiolipin synthase family protein [Sphingomonas fennica]
MAPRLTETVEDEGGGRADEPVFAVGGNRLRLLPDGPARLGEILAVIAQANETLRLLYYIYSDDRAGREVRDALIAACARGVRVVLIVDGFGSDADAEFFRPLTDAGGRVCRFLPRFGRRYLLRNHQKLLLADGKAAIVGGFNIEDDYFGRGDPWRDLGLRIDGPAAAHMIGYFDALHHWVTSRRPRIRALRQALKRWSETKGAVRWLLGGPTRSLSPWAATIRQEMRGCRRMAMIAAYFAPDPALLRTIAHIPRRGGEADVMTAGRSDNNATIAAARHCYAVLLKRGVRVWEYAAAKLHTKLFVIDDVVHIGSANFDVRSLYLNLEIMVRIDDPAFAERMRAYIAMERARATEVTAAAHGRIGWWRRILWGAAYFAVAVIDGNVTRRLNFGIDGR